MKSPSMSLHLCIDFYYIVYKYRIQNLPSDCQYSYNSWLRIG